MKTTAPQVASVDVAQLVTLAVDGLMPMFNAERQLFCYRLRQGAAGLVREGVSHRYTIISLLGLDQSENAGLTCGLDVPTVLSPLLQDTGWLDNIGDLGLILWLCALASPDRLGSLCSRYDLSNALVRFGETRNRRTTELAWFLTGLAHMSLASGRGRQSDYSDLAVTIYRLLQQNQGDSGLFGHQAQTGTLSGRIRGHIGSFADQVYPIYALAKVAQAYGLQEALDTAQKCAGAICRAQGPLGQWWWHYNAVSGTLAERYPVYSVHQDGMAPMALFALADETRLDFTEPIYKGLQWIGGYNEAQSELRNVNERVIWRSVYQSSRYGVWRDRLRYSVGAGRCTDATDKLRTLRECRPYHLGWLLYAFAKARPSLSQGRSDTRGSEVGVPLDSQHS